MKRQDALLPEFKFSSGLVDYPEAVAAMEQRVLEIQENGASELVWFLEHPPLYTIGTSGKAQDVLDRNLPVYSSGRGGQVTYHGPGQIVAYPLFDLRRLGIGVRELVTRIEQAIIDTLAQWNIVALRRAGAPGVYVGEAKIGALGLRVRRGCSFHGLALNVGMDLEPFQRINPCGYQGLQVTQVLDLGGPGSLAVVEDALIEELSRQFDFTPQPGPADLQIPAAGAAATHAA